MISYLEALDLIENYVQTIKTETIKVSDALGRICVHDILSPMDLPSFDNSAMDGFAVFSEVTQNADQENPVRLEIIEIIPAAISQNKSAVFINQCSEIMTGAAVPIGYDAVIPVELVNVVNDNGKSYIEITAPISKADNLRFSGEDVKTGEVVVGKSRQISPGEIMLLLALGIYEIEVYTKISIAVAVSGEEVSENYDVALRYGEIYNSNAPLLMNMLSEQCFVAQYFGILRDNKQTLIDFIEKSAAAQIVITTGAVSKGKWDFIPQTLKELGAEIIFHSVAIRPGKPILFAKLPTGQYFFGLPGNPVSSFVGWRFFVIPLIRKLFNLQREKGVFAKLTGKFNKKHKLRQFLKAKLEIDAGLATVRISPDQESFKIKSLLMNNYWAIAQEDDNLLNDGDLIQLVPIYHDFSSK